MTSVCHLGTTYLSWAHIKAMGESCHWHIHTRWQELSLQSNYYCGYFEVDQLHGKTGTVITKKLKKQPTFKELSPLVKGKTVRIMPLPHDKGQTWFKAVSHSQQCQLRETSLNSQPKHLLQYPARSNLCAQHLTRLGQLKIRSQELVGSSQATWVFKRTMLDYTWWL